MRVYKIEKQHFSASNAKKDLQNRMQQSQKSLEQSGAKDKQEVSVAINL